MVRLNLTPLRALRRKMAEVGNQRVQVGIFSDHDSRTLTKAYHTEGSNASLGAIHEFGLPAYSFLFQRMVLIPQRSFLRMPLMLRLGDELRRLGPSLGFLLLRGSAAQFLKQLGLLGHAIVDEAFATRGYGQWPQISTLTAELKQSDAILIESGQLRDSITYRIV